MSINHVRIKTEKLNNEAYQLNLDFYKDKELQSDKKFIFIKNASGAAREIVDLYSLNCGLSNNLSGVFSGKDVKHLKFALQRVNVADSTIITLDMKDAQKGYIHEEIASGETDVCAFFAGQGATKSKSLSQAKKLLQNKLDFIYCEGTLKGKLLQQFGESEADYLNSKEGSQEFCQLTEVFMNAAKFGHVQQDLFPEQYIFSINPSAAFQAYQTSTIWYPKLYKSSVGSVATIFDPVFATTSFYDSLSGITVLTMVEKE
jgi:hypothetical protein